MFITARNIVGFVITFYFELINVFRVSVCLF